MTLILPSPQVKDPLAQSNFDRISLAWPNEILQWNVVLVNGWVVQAGYGTPRAFKYGDMVSIVMAVNGLGATNVGCCTLPAGWRPSGIVVADLNYWSGAARTPGSVGTSATGVVNITGVNDLLVARDYYYVNMTFSVRS